MLDEQTSHVAHTIAHLRKEGATYIEADPDAEAEWVATIDRLQVLTEGFLLECPPATTTRKASPGVVTAGKKAGSRGW
ncbi:MAG: hypothetical protein QOG75_1186 [Mycobacterium sp.]|jgi:hypothetical protein|nr:hypothetical protein [Mycobacterium sp.]